MATWTIVAVIPQIDGRTRIVSVPADHADEVREALRHDPTRIDRLWCPVDTYDTLTPFHDDDDDDSDGGRNSDADGNL